MTTKAQPVKLRLSSLSQDVWQTKTRPKPRAKIARPRPRLIYQF
jgi:hypothetical protein